MTDQWRNTPLGLARRTGPTTLELLTDRGEVYAMNFAALDMLDPTWEPRHEVDDLFLPCSPTETKGISDGR